MGLHKLILFMTVLGALSAQAQKEDLNVRDPRLNEGQLFTVKLTPKSKLLEISFAGQPAVHLGSDRVEVFGRELHGSESRELTIRPAGPDFQIVERLDPSAPIEFDIRDKKNKKKETFKFNLNERP